MRMGGNGNELSGAIREWEWFFKCVNFGNGNGKDLAGMGGIGNTEKHSRTSLRHINWCCHVAVQLINDGPLTNAICRRRTSSYRNAVFVQTAANLVSD